MSENELIIGRWSWRCIFDYWLLSAIQATTWQNQQSECAPSEDSDQPGHLPSMIRDFAVCMKKPCVLSYPLSAQRRLWSDRANARADLSLRWAHSHFVGFVMSRLNWLFSMSTFVMFMVLKDESTSEGSSMFICGVSGFGSSGSRTLNLVVAMSSSSKDDTCSLIPAQYVLIFWNVKRNLAEASNDLCSNWATARQKQQNDPCAQGRLWPAGHPPSLIRVFADCMKKSWVHSYPLSASKNSNQSGQMPKLIWVFAGCTVHCAGFVMHWLNLFHMYNQRTSGPVTPTRDLSLSLLNILLKPYSPSS